MTTTTASAVDLTNLRNMKPVAGTVAREGADVVLTVQSARYAVPRSLFTRALRNGGLEVWDGADNYVAHDAVTGDFHLVVYREGRDRGWTIPAAAVLDLP